MAKRARVTSVDELRRFKAHWNDFADECRQALMMIRADIGRAESWVQFDRLPYWERMVKRRTKELAQARNDLHRKEMTSDRTIDERRGVERAKRQLEEARRKQRIVKQWATRLPTELDRLTGGVKHLSSTLDREGPAAIASLEQIIQSIQHYLALQIPTSDIRPVESETDDSTAEINEADETVNQDERMES